MLLSQDPCEIDLGTYFLPQHVDPIVSGFTQFLVKVALFAFEKFLQELLKPLDGSRSLYYLVSSAFV
jgi:hypothetical protein